MKNILQWGNNGSYLVIKFQNTSGEVIRDIRFAAEEVTTFGEGIGIPNPHNSYNAGAQGPAWAFDLRQRVKPGQKVTADFECFVDHPPCQHL